MKWLDALFAKIWWSLHPSEAVQMSGMLIEAQLDYPRRCLEFLIAMTDDPDKKREYRKRIRDLYARAYDLPSVTK